MVHAALLPQLSRHPGPSYLRIGRFGERRFESPAPIEVGRARMLRSGERLAILTTGASVIQALEAAESLAQEDIRPFLCHFHTVHPLDTTALETLAEHVEALVVVEEHGLQGGLGAAVSQWCTFTGHALRMVRLGPGDELVIGNPKQEEIRRRFGSDGQGIVETCRRHWSARPPAAMRQARKS